MRLTSLALLVPSLAAVAPAAALPQPALRNLHAPTRVTDDSAFAGLVANIVGAASETNVEGSLAGSVVASPSKHAPDYFYTWTRDAALVAKILVDRYGDERAADNSFATHAQGPRQQVLGHQAQDTSSPLAVPLRTLLENWARSEMVHQFNAASAPAGQGEPKFHVGDGHVYMGPWGRPQTDGPALRATALMQFARLIGLNDSFTKDFLYHSSLDGTSLIKNDLEYVAHHWWMPTFDLWEELNERHFFTLSVQRRALLEGAEFADQMGDHGAAAFYRLQGLQISVTLQGFWDQKAQRVQAYNVPWRSGVDCATLLGSLHGWNQSSIESSLDEAQFGPASQRMLATVEQYLSTFRSLYTLNRNKPARHAVLTGRYPEDDYAGYERSGGNPWYMCTLATSELLDDAATVFDQAEKLEVTPATRLFFAQWDPRVSLGPVRKHMRRFDVLTGGMRELAAEMRDLVQIYAYPNGSMSEQIDRHTGQNVGARELTWNYAAWLAASKAARGTPVF